MWCQLTAPHASSGQISVTIWPLYSLYNALPAPVHWRLSNSPLASNGSSSGSSGKLVSDRVNKNHQAAQDLEKPEHGVLQPGIESPLAVALSSHQTLSFALMPQQDSHPPSRRQPNIHGETQSWSVPLHTCDPGRDTAASPDRLQPTHTDALPQAGLWQPLDIPTSQGSSPLSCMLVAQPGLHQAGPVCLCLVPHAVLHNSLPFEVSLTCPGSEQEIHIPAGTSQALDWSHLQYRPKKVALAVTESSYGVRLQSHAFALDGNHDSPLTLSTSATASSQVTEFHAAVRVQNDPFEIRSGPGGVGGGVTMEVAHISVTPGGFVSNLTQHHITLKLASCWKEPQGPVPRPQSSSTHPTQPQGPLHQPQGPPAQPLSSQHQLAPPEEQATWHLTCAPSQTNPILNAWHYPLQTPPQRPKPSLTPPTPSLAVTVQLEPSPPFPTLPLPPQDSDRTGGSESWQHESQTTGLQTVDVPLPDSHQILHTEATARQATITLMQPSGRAHLLLSDPHARPQDPPEPLLLAYRCMLSQGRMHLVFFTDPQPPCMLHNAAPEAVCVMWCTLQRDKQGTLHEVNSEEWMTVAVGGAVDCSPRSSMPPGHPGV